MLTAREKQRTEHARLLAKLKLAQDANDPGRVAAITDALSRLEARPPRVEAP